SSNSINRWYPHLDLCSRKDAQPDTAERWRSRRNGLFYGIRHDAGCCGRCTHACKRWHSGCQAYPAPSLANVLWFVYCHWILLSRTREPSLEIAPFSRTPARRLQRSTTPTSTSLPSCLALAFADFLAPASPLDECVQEGTGRHVCSYT